MLEVPSGYVSGVTLSNTTTWDNTTISGMGLTPGTYSWTWGSGATADSYVMQIPTPEPATLTLLGTALLGLGVVYLRRRGAKAPTRKMSVAASEGTIFAARGGQVSGCAMGRGMKRGVVGAAWRWG